MNVFLFCLLASAFLQTISHVEAVVDESTFEDWELPVDKENEKFLETYKLELPEEWKNRVPQPAPTEKRNRFGTRNSGKAASKSTFNTLLPSVEESDVKASYAGVKPHILVFLMDDLGYHDVGYADEPRKKATLSTPYMTKLAKEEGIILTRHYAHWHCSPSRRAFLSGRLPVHSGGENLSHLRDDDLDVRFTWLSEKLSLAKYENYFFGKHHLGFKSVRMLPILRSFKHHLGFIEGSMQYNGSTWWKNFKPYKNLKRGKKTGEFSTKKWGHEIYTKFEKVLQEQKKRGGRKYPLFLYASFQAPHSPLVEPPKYYANQNSNWTELSLLDKNMFAVDVEMKKTIDLFKKDEAVWNNTLVLFLSDNGGTKRIIKGEERENMGNNYPLRSEKSSSFEGAFRVTSFISGGIIPPSLRGTKNDKISHIADWYRTFCNLAGVNGDDDPPKPIAYPNLTVEDVGDPQKPNYSLPDKTNPYGKKSYPKVDSVDLWPMLMHPHLYAQDAVRPYLVLSTEAIIKGDYKLVLAQPCASGNNGKKPCKGGIDFGWDPQEDGFDPQDENFSPWLADPSLGCLKVFDVRNMAGFTFEPCLFNLKTDEREQDPINDPAKIEELWADLNQTLVYQYNKKLQGKLDGVSHSPRFERCLSPEKAAECYYGNEKNSRPAPLCGFTEKECKKFVKKVKV